MFGRLEAEFTDGGILLALSAGSITLMSALLFGFSPSLHLVVAAFLFTYATYALNRTGELKQDVQFTPHRARLFISRLPSRILLPLLYVTTFVIVFAVSVPLALALMIVLLIGAMYTYGLGSREKSLGRLKDRFMLKNVTISSVWASIPLLLLLYYPAASIWVGLAIFTLLFIRSFVVSAFCDLKDIDADRGSGVRTLPIVLGSSATRLTLSLLNLAFSGLVMVYTVLHILPLAANLFHLITAYSLLYIWRSRRDCSDNSRLCTLVADSEDLFFAPLIVLGTVFQRGVVS